MPSKIFHEKIFIQIASYRDPQLLPTLRDMFANADHPENINVGIAWQRCVDDEWDNLDEYKDDKRVKIIEIDYKKAKGVCWARNAVQSLYDNEDYTLQLDSHHRFVKDWDTKLKDMLKGLQKDGYKKPLITAYIPSLDPDNDPGRTQMEVDLRTRSHRNPRDWSVNVEPPNRRV